MSRRIAPRLAALGLLLLLTAAAGWIPAPTPRKEPPLDRSDARATEPELDRLRDLYLAAVADEGAIQRGLAEIDAVRRSTRPASGSWADGTLEAYRGALITLRAKHALWPVTKMRHLRDGLEVLDSVVARQPQHAEARYLRLMSCYYLPGILGRGHSVREDFAELAHLLPHVRGRYPAPLYGAIVRFVLDQGRLTTEQRRPLEAALARADE